MSETFQGVRSLPRVRGLLGWQGPFEGQGLFRESEAFRGSGRFPMKKDPQEIMLYCFFHQKSAGYQDKELLQHNTRPKENVHGCS